MQVCDVMHFCSPRCESRDVRGLDGTETSDLCSVMCIAETTFAMRCIFTAICTLAAEIQCDVGHDASITASAMLRCGELRLVGDQEAWEYHASVQGAASRQEEGPGGQAADEQGQGALGQNKGYEEVR